jgi:hypothetical protein
MELTKICKTSCTQAISIVAFILITTVQPLAAAESYDIISKKNLFRPDRSEWVIDKQESKLAEKKIDPDKLELFGTIIVGDKKSALIYNKKAKVKVKRRRNIKAKKTELYTLGDYLGGYIISAIEEKRVVLDFYGEKVTLNLHEGKEPTKGDYTPLEEKKPKAKRRPKPKKRKARDKMKHNKKRGDTKHNSGEITKALAQADLMSQENMKKVLEFNKEIMKELKESGGTINQAAIKEKVEEFRDRFMEEMGQL